MGSAQWRTAELPVGGQQNCPFVANRFALGSVGEWRHPLSGGGLGEADAVAGGHLTMWAWCSSRSTVALAMVLGMSSSNPAG